MSDLVERLRDAAALPTGLYAEAADAIDRKDADIAELESSLAASGARIEFLQASFDTAMALLRDAQKIVSDYQSRS